MTIIEQSVERIPFVETSISRAIHETIDFVLSLRATAVVIGKPGIGKTKSLQQLAGRDPHAVFVEYRQRYRTAKGMHTAIMDAARWSYWHKTGFELEEACEACASNMIKWGQYLLIDEYQNYDLEAVRSVLRFHDDYRLPIVFVGNERRLRRVSADSHTYDQIADRIWKTVRLGDPIADDFTAFATAYGITRGDTRAAVVKLGLATSLRSVGQVLQAAIEMNGPELSLTVDHLREAEALLRAKTATRAVL